MSFVVHRTVDVIYSISCLAGARSRCSGQFLFNPNRRSFLHARFQLDGQTGWFEQLEIHAAHQIITDDRLTQAQPDSVIVTEKNSSTLDGVTLQINSRLPNDTQLTWGAEYYTDAVASLRFEQPADTGELMEVRSRFPNGSSMDSSAVYLSAEWLLFRNLTMTTGLRYSGFSIKLPTTSNLDAVKLSPSSLTGDLHLLYSINHKLKLVANFGKGFRPPNIFDLATLGPRPGNRFNVANADLKPETVWSYDLGTKAETDKLELEIFVFYLDYSDKITSVFTGETTSSGRDVVRSENQSRVKIYGLEAGINWKVTDKIRGFAVFNYTHGEENNDSESGFPADRIPPFNGRIGANYDFNDRWQIESYLLFAGNQGRLSPRDIRDPRINPLGTPAWASLNLLLDWQASPALQLGLRLENLTDKAYREHASGIDAAGRNVGLWLSFSF